MTFRLKHTAAPSRHAFALALLAAFALAVALLLAPLSAPGDAWAVTSAERQADADAIAANIDALQTQLNAAYAEYDAATQRHDEAEAAAAEAHARVEAAEARAAELQDILGERAVEMYKMGGGVAFLDVVLGANNFHEFLTSWDTMNLVARVDAELIEEAKQMRAEAQAAQEEYEAQSAAAAEEMERAQEALNEIDAAKSALEAQLAQVNEEIVQLQAKEEAERIAAEEARQRQELARQAVANAQFNAGSGQAAEYVDYGTAASTISGWVNPIPSYTRVSNPFGWAGAWDGEYHNGIDLSASMGSTIYAAGPGTVTYVGWYGSGGNAVIVSHGNGVRTIYMHMSGFACSQGQSVSAGDPVGYVGMTGYTTGPHLHFQIEINGTPVDPQNYYSF